jgi:hypothetical protein
MNTMDEIERAIAGLQPRELERIAALVTQRLNEQWDQQMERDSAGGKLDFLFEEAARERGEGKLREWPASES